MSRLAIAFCASSVMVLALPVWLAAQAPAQFQSLAMPPRDVGTCVNAPAPADSSKRYVRTTLLITSRAPSARREISTLRDSTGATIAFNENLHLSTTRLASAGEFVVATLRPDGSTPGYRLSSRVEMADNGIAQYDTASVRRMLERAKKRSTRAELDAGEQGKVRALAAWLASRCPAH